MGGMAALQGFGASISRPKALSLFPLKAIRKPSFQMEKLDINRLKAILAQILKHDCSTRMGYLQRQSEEVFGNSTGKMAELKAEELKQSWNSEVQLIHKLCYYIMSKPVRTELIHATLSILHAFLSWIPLEVYANGSSEEKEFIQNLALFHTSLYTALLCADPFDVEGRNKVEAAIWQELEVKETTIVIMFAEHELIIGMDKRITIDGSISDEHRVKFRRIDDDIYMSGTGKWFRFEDFYDKLLSLTMTMLDVSVTNVAKLGQSFVQSVTDRNTYFVFGFEDKQPKAYHIKLSGMVEIHEVPTKLKSSFSSIGSGSVYALRELETKYHPHILVNQARELARICVLKSSLQDPFSGGSIVVRHVTPRKLVRHVKTQEDLVVKVYREKFHELAEINSRAIFMVFERCDFGMNDNSVGTWLGALGFSMKNEVRSSHIIGGSGGDLALDYVLRLLLFKKVELANRFLKAVKDVDMDGFCFSEPCISILQTLLSENVMERHEDFPEVKVDYQETFLGHTSPITRCRFAASGNYIAIGSEDGIVRIWTYKQPQPFRDATICCGAKIMSLAWECESDRLLLIGTADGSIKVWDVIEKRVVCDLSTSEEFPSVLDIKCSPRESIFVSAAASKGYGSSYVDSSGFASLTVWDMKTLKAVTVLPLGKDSPAVTSLSFNHSGRLLAAAAIDGMIYIFDMLSCFQMYEWRAHDCGISSIIFGPDGSNIFSLGVDGKVFEWSWVNKSQRILWSRDCSRFFDNEILNEMALDPSGRKLLVSSTGSVRAPIYQVRGPGKEFTLRHSGAITTVDWHPTLPIYLTGSADNSVRLVRVTL